MVKFAAGIIRSPYLCVHFSLLSIVLNQLWSNTPRRAGELIHSLLVHQTVTQTAVLNTNSTHRKVTCPCEKGASITEV